MGGYSRADMRSYMRRYRAGRMAWAHAFLGRKCARCQATANLQFDHIDPSTKVKAVTQLLHASRAVFEGEVEKCQLLCVDCHATKSERERPAVESPRHGTSRTYNVYGCRCQSCREAKRHSRIRRGNPMDGDGSGPENR